MNFDWPGASTFAPSRPLFSHLASSTLYMDITQDISEVFELLGGVQPSTVDTVRKTVDTQIKYFQHYIDAKAAGSSPHAQSLAALIPRPPHPPPGMTSDAFFVLSSSMSTFIYEKGKGVAMLPLADRTLQCRQQLVQMRMAIDTAVARLITPDAARMTSSSRVGACTDAPGEVPRSLLVSPLTPVNGALAPHTLSASSLAPLQASLGPLTPLPTSDVPTSPLPHSASPAVQPARRCAPVKESSLPFDVLVQILESMNSLADIERFVTALPKAAVAQSRVGTLALIGGEPVAPWWLCTKFPKLRVLSLDTPLQHDSLFSPPLRLRCLMLDQGDVAWTEYNTQHVVDVLQLATVETIVVENAHVAALELLAIRAGRITQLRCLFGGERVDVGFTMANGFTRTFTRLRVEDVALSFLLQTAITPSLTHVEISDWLPRNWICMFFEHAPVSLVSFEVMLSRMPPLVSDPDVDLQHLTHYRGRGWTGCDQLRTLTLSTTTPTIEVTEACVRAFMDAAFFRRVSVELRGVAYRTEVRS
ncbi:hypothetical protein AURDEDRAFT_166031 [Auricularia subglabra TFB-10046 SS5]|nr:hypothetical protein AURDEDRAFT_166031 [Auricularia subglabra TFB-10046 SS5]